MKKLLTIAFICFMVLGCTSNASDTVQKSIVVNTGVYADGGIYTTVRFSNITSVDVIDMTTKDRRTLEPKDYIYNADKNMIELQIPAQENAGYSIRGTYDSEMLHLKDIDGEPLVMLNGAKLTPDKDYKFDSKSSVVEFCTPIDLDKDSYVVFYMTNSGSCTFGNAYDKSEEQYQSYIMEYISERYKG